MARIRILPSDIVNRIAAGEVIERPASVIKELVENSIDAGATEIAVEVEEGGRNRIRVRDNGAGIPADELPLAFRSHATSKIPLADPGAEAGGLGEDRTALDLFDIGTLGFRGEALASIASVAEVEAVSRTAEAECAWRFRLRGTLSAGDAPAGEGPDPVAGPPGTSIEVRNLFFNVPARRKFLRAASTELSHVMEQMVRLALGFPGIRFELMSGGRRLLDCPAAEGLRDRLASVLGRERASELLEIRDPQGGVPGLRIQGFVGPPSLHRADARGQQFFVGGRWVRDRIIGSALQDAFKGFQIPGQRPLAYLFLDVPPGSLDVNVHPTKSEVRFLDSSAVFRKVQGAVRSALDAKAGGGTAPAAATGGTAGSGGDAGGADKARERVFQAARDFFAAPRREVEGRIPPRPVREAGRDGERAPRPAVGPGDERPWDLEHRVAPAEAPPPAPPPSAAQERTVPVRQAALEGEAPALRPVQLFQTYIAIESGDDLVLFDQHALHEKILFERILEQMRAGPMPRQRLLFPEVVTLPLELVPLLEETARRLSALGFEAEPFGPRELAVHAVPAVLESLPAGPIVLEAARWIREGSPGGTVSPGTPGSAAPAGPDPLGAEARRLAQIIACKRAVKAGMPLEAAEVQALFAGALEAADPRFCPHGRPTSTVITRSELERRFQRK